MDLDVFRVVSNTLIRSSGYLASVLNLYVSEFKELQMNTRSALRKRVFFEQYGSQTLLLYVPNDRWAPLDQAAYLAQGDEITLRIADNVTHAFVTSPSESRIVAKLIADHVMKKLKGKNQIK